MTAPSSADPGVRRPIAELITGAAWLVGLSAVLAIGDGLLQRVPIARATLGALATSVAVGRAGVVWDELDPAGKAVARPARLMLQGAGRSATATIVGLAAAALFGFAEIKPGNLDVSVLLGIVLAAATSVREELLYRALPFSFIERALPKTKRNELATVAFAALLSPTAFLLAPGTTPAAIALSFSLGLLAARIRARTGSIWGAVASTFAARLVLGPTLQTSLVTVAWVKGEATMSPLASGAAAWIVAGLVVLVAIVGVPAQPRTASAT